ncbi:MAG: shikimate dehydrogenase [Chloroflexota bacterium]|nr:shikimate dehydrogenase [Chloroflexota bacterium]
MICLGLTGYPLAHSLSPRIHQAALDHAHLKGSYKLFPIAPDDLNSLQALLAQVRDGELDGLNVTIPHKQHVLPFLDALTPEALAIGAVNTIVCREGKLVGANTDAPGFLADLRQAFPRKPWELAGRKHALVLGAGGAARAVVYALLSDGWQVTLAARRIAQAQALADDIKDSGESLAAIALKPDVLQPLVDEVTLLVNCTPLGMHPNEDASPWPQGLALPPLAAVYDLVYNPRETRLVQSACAAGLPAAGGLGMLLAQAALAFEIWTDIAVPRPVWAAAVEEA